MFLLKRKSCVQAQSIKGTYEQASEKDALKGVFETKKGVRQTDSFQVAQLGTDTVK